MAQISTQGLPPTPPPLAEAVASAVAGVLANASTSGVTHTSGDFDFQFEVKGKSYLVKVVVDPAAVGSTSRYVVSFGMVGSSPVISFNFESPHAWNFQVGLPVTPLSIGSSFKIHTASAGFIYRRSVTVAKP